MVYQNHTAAYLISSQQQGIIDTVSQPIFYLTVSLVFAVVVIVGLIVYVRILQMRRPRIKKRFIVNKNVTPLSYTSQPKDHCVTIENCCNMNICETVSVKKLIFNCYCNFVCLNIVCFHHSCIMLFLGVRESCFPGLGFQKFQITHKKN